MTPSEKKHQQNLEDLAGDYTFGYYGDPGDVGDRCLRLQEQINQLQNELDAIRDGYKARKLFPKG